ncbi:hypothetical protein H2203_003076 [Taxawa tesnikishii (nom. ined.)]|nr:hypothetical protein H2203_003076 [Dothideales sp. JES 119]
MASSNHFDVLVIGSGQAGTPLAEAFAKHGRKTALIERSHIGGCCVNEGCTPTKTMIASGRVAYLRRRAADYGVHADAVNDGPVTTRIDLLKVRQRKRDIVDNFRGGSTARVEAAGVTVLEGDASFQDAHTLKVSLTDGSSKSVSGDLIFINTGERPMLPNLEGLSALLDNGNLPRQSHNCPKGSTVAPREDPDIAKKMQDILEEDNISIHLHTDAIKVTIPPSDPITLHTRNSGGTLLDIRGSHLLLATGRTPNTDTLNLNAAGITPDARGYIPVSVTLQTAVPHIYALGDVKGPPSFTHISYDDFRIIRTNLLEASSSSPSLSQKTITDRVVPYVIFTDPQLAHVGLHESEARAKYPIQVAKMPMSYVARALETDESRGVMKAVVHKETGAILGFTCLGIEGGEVMSVVQMAMLGGVPWMKLKNVVFAHPTLAEGLNNLWGFLE